MPLLWFFLIFDATTHLCADLFILFIAICSFFPCSLTVCERGRKQKSGGRQQKSQVDNRKRGGRQQKSSRADKWNDFLIIWPV